MVRGPFDLALELAEILDRLSIPYVLGGSLASSLLGEPRSTADVDFAVRMSTSDIDRLLEAIGTTYYMSREAAVEAVKGKGSFNLIHSESVQKVDLFVLGEGLLDRRQFENRRRMTISKETGHSLWVGAPEDQVLRKLAWYRAGQGISDRQWRDVVSILAVQRDSLNLPDLRGAASELELGDLLERALEDASED